jgi:ABC-type multidrug transport system fused ATPase/permease subunit
MPKSLYTFIWQESGRQQIWLCLLTAVVVPLSTVPLELQRRIINDALGARNAGTLLLLCGLYLLAILVQGGLKYLLNIYRGRVVETVIRSLRNTIYRHCRPTGEENRPDHEFVDRGGIVSMIASEAEDLGGFVGESLSMPLLQAGTALSVLGYLVWVQPFIASFAVVIYLPQLVIVPTTQRVINRFARSHAKVVRKMGDHIVAEAAIRGNPARRFARLVDQALETRINIYRIKYFLTFFGNFLDAIGPLGVLLVGGWMVIRGQTEVSTLVVFISGFQRVSDPFDVLVNYYRGASNARVQYQLILDSMPPGVVGAPAAKPPAVRPAA